MGYAPYIFFLDTLLRANILFLIVQIVFQAIGPDDSLFDAMK